MVGLGGMLSAGSALFTAIRRGARMGKSLRFDPAVAKPAGFAVVWLVAVMLAGGGPSSQQAEIRDVVRVATEHGTVMRRLTPPQFRRLEMRGLRFGLVVGGGLALGGAVSA